MLVGVVGMATLREGIADLPFSATLPTTFDGTAAFRETLVPATNEAAIAVEGASLAAVVLQ